MQDGNGDPVNYWGNTKEVLTHFFCSGAEKPKLDFCT